MTDYKMVSVKPAAYLYQERVSSMDPNDISQNMRAAFETVAGFMLEKGIASAGHALSVYITFDSDKMPFRAGFLVSEEDAGKAEGDVKADVLPAGEFLNFLHRGPYATLANSYDAMMKHLEAKGMSVGMPSWEIYLNDPSTVASEAELETDVYVTVA